jgi:hypothetical protein
MIAVRAPPAVGENVALNVHPVPDSTSDGQLLVWLKSPALTPPIVLRVIVTVPPAPEVFVYVNGCEADDVPTVWLAKVRDAGRKVIVSAAGTVT